MFKNYLKIVCRNLLKSKLSSLINIVGLSAAIGCSIVFFLLLELEYTSDRFHEKAENIFLTGYTLEGDQKEQRWGDSPLPLGPAVEKEFPQVKKAVRIADRQGTVRIGDRVFNESIRFVDTYFLEMFTFPLELGEKKALLDKSSLVLSKDYAEKYFGGENPVGKQIEIIFNREYKEVFFVMGVAEEFPIRASFSFNILASYEKMREIGAGDLNDWGGLTDATFIEVGSPGDIPAIAARLDKYVQHHNKARIDRPIAKFIFEPLTTLSWESQEIERSISSGSTPEALIMLFIIGMFLLMQACFNYINIALATGSRRLKEIGVRKVLGGKRFQLVKQFLGENLLLCFTALVVGIILAQGVFLPGLFEITGSSHDVSLLYFFNNIHLWIFYVVLLLLTGVGAGLYPALIITKSRPINILKGSFKIKGKNRFTRVLLAFQFGITFLILCLVISFWQNNRHQLKRDWGYNQENVINIKLDKGEQFAILNNVVSRNPEVLKTAGTVHCIGRSAKQAVIEADAEKHEVICFDVGAKYPETLGMRLQQGRSFDPDLSTDRESLIVNEEFLRAVADRYPLTKTIRYENKIYKVVGVVKDFHYRNFFEAIEPVIIRMVPEEAFAYMTVRANPGREISTAGFIKDTWRNLFPDIPYNEIFQDSVFDSAFRNNEYITKIFAATALITLIISCMGLFGLVTLMISKRMKELSIHKVLGASVRQIAKLITGRFVLLLGAATLLALPLGYFLIKNLLDAVYRYHIEVNIFPFAAAALVVFLTGTLTIASHVYRAAVKNPIDDLRYE